MLAGSPSASRIDRPCPVGKKRHDRRKFRCQHCGGLPWPTFTDFVAGVAVFPTYQDCCTCADATNTGLDGEDFGACRSIDRLLWCDAMMVVTKSRHPHGTMLFCEALARKAIRLAIRMCPAVV